MHIWDDVLGKPDERYQYQQGVYKFIHDALCREYGLFHLSNEGDIPYVAVANYLLITADTQRVLDLIELSFKTIDLLVRSDLPRYQTTGEVIDDAIGRLFAERDLSGLHHLISVTGQERSLPEQLWLFCRLREWAGSARSGV